MSRLPSFLKVSIPFRVEIADLQRNPLLEYEEKFHHLFDSGKVGIVLPVVVCITKPLLNTSSPCDILGFENQKVLPTSASGLQDSYHS